MQQAARFGLATISAIRTNNRVKEMRNADFLQPLTRRPFAVIGQHSQFETRIGQLRQRGQKIPFWHRIAATQIADDALDLGAIGVVFLKIDHPGRQQFLPDCTNLEKGPARKHAVGINDPGVIINPDIG